MYALANVGKSFRDGTTVRWILRDISLTIQEGETVVLWGPSGSGKTTLLNLLAGLSRPTQGIIEFKTERQTFNLMNMDENRLTRFRRDHIGFIYQFFNLVPTLNVRENVELPIELTRRFELKEEAIHRLDTLGLNDRLSEWPSNLSGGEQQRVAIARSLAHRPRFILADEPTGNLDRHNARQVLDLLWRETESTGTGLVIASHSEDVLKRATKVVELST